MVKEIKITDMPKLESPFVRELINDTYIVVDKINPGYEWVFENPDVIACEKLDGTNVSILIEDGQIKSIWNRTERIPFFNKGKRWIVEGVYNSFERGYMEFLPDGQHFGELIGPKVQSNHYKLDEHLWMPFNRMRNGFAFKSFGKYPKNFAAFSEWCKTLMPLYGLHLGLGKDTFVEGIVFYHPDGRMAKLRKDMWDWYEGDRHRVER
jgi:hypothetical protein